jgi:hypothetical protein
VTHLGGAPKAQGNQSQNLPVHPTIATLVRQIISTASAEARSRADASFPLLVMVRFSDLSRNGKE